MHSTRPWGSKYRGVTSRYHAVSRHGRKLDPYDPTTYQLAAFFDAMHALVARARPARETCVVPGERRTEGPGAPSAHSGVTTWVHIRLFGSRRAIFVPAEGK
ncbi:hypothetical protein GCM10027184_05280 [Saccharothrix stipae]